MISPQPSGLILSKSKSLSVLSGGRARCAAPAFLLREAHTTEATMYEDHQTIEQLKQTFDQLTSENNEFARALQLSDEQLEYARNALNIERENYAKLNQAYKELEEQLVNSHELTKLYQDVERYKTRINKDAELIRSLAIDNSKLRNQLSSSSNTDDTFPTPADDV